MVFGSRPVTLLVKLPVPVPSVVLELLRVGASVVAQQTPLAVTAAPPSEEILPPETAELSVIDEAAVVVRTGATAELVVNVTSLP